MSEMERGRRLQGMSPEVLGGEGLLLESSPKAFSHVDIVGYIEASSVGDKRPCGSSPECSRNITKGLNALSTTLHK